MSIDNLFSRREIEEIWYLKEITSNSTVNGEMIFCFDILHELIIGKKNITDISSEQLLHAYSQIKGTKEFLSSFVFLDLRNLENIQIKTKKIFRDEIRSRNIKSTRKMQDSSLSRK